MASSIVLRRSPSLFINKLIHPLRSSVVVPSISRAFNTSAQIRDSEEDGRGLDIERRPESAVRRRDLPPNFFSDVFDPLSPTRSLSQVLNMMDQFMDSPFGGLSRPPLGGGLRRGWDAKEDDNALYLRIDMPGLGKEDVNVSVEQDTLVIRGKGGQEGEDQESVRNYSSRIDLPSEIYKFDEIKAEMKNGVLKVLVPKAKEEQRKDVRQVQVE